MGKSLLCVHSIETFFTRRTRCDTLILNSMNCIYQDVLLKYNYNISRGVTK